MLCWWCKLCSPISGRLQERQSIKMPLRGVHNLPPVSGQAGSSGLCLMTNLMMDSWRITVDYSSHIHSAFLPVGTQWMHFESPSLALWTTLSASWEWSNVALREKICILRTQILLQEVGVHVGSKVGWGHLGSVKANFVPFGPGAPIGNSTRRLHCSETVTSLPYMEEKLLCQTPNSSHFAPPSPHPKAGKKLELRHRMYLQVQESRVS